MAKRFARFEIRESHRIGKHRYWWRLVGGNGEVICTSERYTREIDATRSLMRVVELLQSGKAEMVS